MEIKKGRIKKIGELEQSTKTGTHYVTIDIQIGVDKTFDRYTGEQKETPELVAYVLFHDEAREAAMKYSVGDVVEFELSHYINYQWHRTEVRTANIRIVQKAGVQSTQQQLMERQAQKSAEQQQAMGPAGDGERLPF